MMGGFQQVFRRPAPAHYIAVGKRGVNSLYAQNSSSKWGGTFVVLPQR